MVIDAEGVQDVEQGGDEGEELECDDSGCIRDSQCWPLPTPPRGPQACALTLLCPLSTPCPAWSESSSHWPIAPSSWKLSTRGVLRPHSVSCAHLSPAHVSSCHKAACLSPCPGPSLVSILLSEVFPLLPSITVCALMTPSVSLAGPDSVLSTCWSAPHESLWLLEVQTELLRCHCKPHSSDGSRALMLSSYSSHKPVTSTAPPPTTTGSTTC